MKTLIIVLTIVMLLGIVEHDELRIFTCIKKFKGKIDFYGLPSWYGRGFIVNFPDDSVGYFIANKCLWKMYIEQGEEGTIAHKCIEAINRRSIAFKFLGKEYDL